MSIGEVARRVGVTAKAVRYYESLGLITVARRSNGYRDYDESHVRQIREIRAVAGLGIRVDQAKPFLDCLAGGNERGDDCAASVATYRATIASLDSRIAELSSRREALVELVAAAGGQHGPLCEFSGEFAGQDALARAER
jgi:DNA-binding transcriptional MerR regulator